MQSNRNQLLRLVFLPLTSARLNGFPQSSWTCCFPHCQVLPTALKPLGAFLLPSFFFSFFGYTRSTWNFLGQRFNPTILP